MTEPLDVMEDRILDKAKRAIETKEYERASFYMSLAQEARTLQEAQERILRSLEEDQPPIKVGAVPGTALSAGAVLLEVTQGDLNQNCLRVSALRAHLLIPTDDTQITVWAMSPFGDFTFLTRVDQQNGRLHERGMIARFYRENAVKAGDKITWSRVHARKFQLSKV